LLGVSETEYSAKDLARKAIALDDTLAEAHASLAYHLSALDWNWTDAEKEFRRSIELDPNYATRKGEFNEVGIAWTYAALGDNDEAFQWLQEAFRRRIGELALVKVEPRFERLRPDSRFADLLRQMNLTP
jgi:tetratricopeptide (TPR) repeat protein